MDSLVATLIESVLLPLISVVTGSIPLLISSGALLLVFSAMWLALGAAIVRAPARVDAAWHRVRSLPIVVQAIAWMLFLPVLAGVWVWRRHWPRLARVTVVGLLACWNVVMFLPAPA